jgi:DNA polymerase-1
LLGYSTVRALETPTTGKKQLTITFAPLDRVSSCAADDARISLELARYYLERPLDADQQYLLYEMDLPLSAVLARMEQAGVCLDLPYLSQLSTELGADIDRLEGEIYQSAGHSFNIGSPLQLQKVLFEELGLKTKARTKTGYSTDAAVLESLRDEHEIIPKILEYRQLTKLRSTYVDSLPPQVSQRDGRLHGEFNQASTATGRLSSSNPNLQNIPIKTEVGRKIRRAFIPQSKDSVLLSADYSQIELRLLAHMSGDPNMRDAFERDQDIHARTAASVFEVETDAVTSDQRRVGKTLNFALVYQQGPQATARGLGITMKEAQTFIDKYFKGFPNVRGFNTRTIEEARANSYVQTLWGRRRFFRNLNDRSDMVRKADERAAVNAPLQGSAADLMKLAMIKLDSELKERGLKSTLILQVHDELVLEVPKSELAETTEVVRQSMELGQPLKVPLRVDVGAGDNWMDAK